MIAKAALFGGTLLAALNGPSGLAEAALRHRAPSPEAVQPFARPEPQFPLNANWTLADVNGKPAPGDPPSFRLDDTYRASGFSGCNTYSMTLYPVRGQKLGAGSIAMTRKQCDRAVMLFEHAFLVCLHAVPTWSSENGDLVVKCPATVLRFRRGI